MEQQRRRRRVSSNNFPAGDPDIHGSADVGTGTEPDAAPGTEITIAWGEETFSPVQYNSFRIGGHSIKVVVQPGETALDAFARGWAILEQAAQVMFDDKMAGFRNRMNQTKR